MCQNDINQYHLPTLTSTLTSTLTNINQSNQHNIDAKTMAKPWKNWPSFLVFPAAALSH
jgi:hypothetical protein